MKQIDTLTAQKLILDTNGSIFTVIFTKKDGTERKMNCRLGVTKHVKGIGLNYTPADYDLITVFDMQVKNYRMISLNTIKALQINKQFYVVG